MSKRLLCVWLPNWPVQRVQAEEPLLADKPLLLSTRDPRRGLVVTAANLQAREEGVRAGMRLSEANALCEAELQEQDSFEDIETLCHLAEQAQQFSPIVGLEQLERKRWAGRTLHQPECLLLDITGIGSLFGSEEKLLQELGNWLRRQGYFGCMAVAGSVGAAWAIANYGLRQAHGGQECSVDSDEETPFKVPVGRYQIAPPGKDREIVAGLPLAALRLPQDTVASLRKLGIHTIGQLETLPRNGLATRLGETLIQRWDQILGSKAEPVVTLHSLPDWCLEQTLEHPTESRETVEELLRIQIQQLAQRLQKRGQGALRILCRLDLQEQPPLLMQLGLFRPTNDRVHLGCLLSGQLEQTLRANPAALIWRLSLQATMTADLVWRQGDLFDSSEATNRNQIAYLVDTLSSRLGRKQVLSATIKRESQPELAYTLQPMTGRKIDGQQHDTVKKLSSRLARRRAEPSPEDPLRRPSHVLTKPQRIEVRFADQAKDSTEGRFARAPAYVHYRNQWYQVIENWGPERLESGWWRGPSARRDYYRIAVQDGSWWWIFRDLNSGQWFMHGVFD